MMPVGRITKIVSHSSSVFVSLSCEQWAHLVGQASENESASLLNRCQQRTNLFECQKCVASNVSMPRQYSDL